MSEKAERKIERCPYDPSGLIGVPLGQFHCPYCGDMVVAGLPHPPSEGELVALFLEALSEADADDRRDPGPV